jgi:hypothetical protein
MHSDVIRAHVERDVDLWMSMSGELYTSVNSGTISFPTFHERREQRSAYLNSTTFDMYRDIREPIVRISQDGTLGWLIAEVEISGSTARSENQPESFHDIWAWIEMYEKEEGAWRIVGNVSNRR